MGHHGQDMTPEQRRHLEKFFEDCKPGPTNKFPEGKIHQSDKGELRFGVGHKDGKVILAFGVPTDWVGMGKEQALQLANAIIDHASQL
jgi:hypothetical protein